METLHMADQNKPAQPKRDQKDAATDLPEREVAPKNAENVKGGKKDILEGRV